MALVINNAYSERENMMLPQSYNGYCKVYRKNQVLKLINELWLYYY
jgi:hypothetical protein